MVILAGWHILTPTACLAQKLAHLPCPAAPTVLPHPCQTVLCCELHVPSPHLLTLRPCVSHHVLSFAIREWTPMSLPQAAVRLWSDVTEGTSTLARKGSMHTFAAYLASPSRSLTLEDLKTLPGAEGWSGWLPARRLRRMGGAARPR